MAFRFSIRVTLICLLLAILFGRLSMWQWERYLQKLEIVKALEYNISQPPVPLSSLLPLADASWKGVLHRRVTLTGTYDYDHEIILRNRRHEGFSGVHVITPLAIDGTNKRILVNRGFVPLENSTVEMRKKFRRTSADSFTGLIKESSKQKLFSPSDPDTGQGLPWVDAFLRVDIPKISAQLPYEILPVYLEVADTSDARKAVEEVVASSSHGRDELLAMSGQGLTQSFGMNAPELDYPIPTFNTILPPDRHLGYVYEWGIMSFATIIIGGILQFRRPRRAATVPVAASS